MNHAEALQPTLLPTPIACVFDRNGSRIIALTGIQTEACDAQHSDLTFDYPGSTIPIDRTNELSDAQLTEHLGEDGDRRG